jgi:hypothetical protein
MSTVPYVWWTPWSYDLAIFQAQSLLWTFVWSDKSFTGLFDSVYFWSAMLTVFGVLTVLKYGKRALYRALFCTLGMEFALWAGYWVASTGRQTQYPWTVVVYVIYTLMLLVYGNIAFTKTHAMRRPRDTERRLHRCD